MSFAKIKTALVIGISANIIDVECDIGRGINSFSIIGLTDKAINEAKDRVGSSLRNSGYSNPKQIQKKTTISLAPANIRKEGSVFDLPIAISYLMANEEILYKQKEVDESIFVGELSLKGEVRPISGALIISEIAKKHNIKNIFLPKENAWEAALIKDINVYGVASLKEVIEHLNGKKVIEKNRETNIEEMFEFDKSENKNDISNIKGQRLAKRALEISIAGGHNVAFFGPPGTGKTMLAKAAKYLLPTPDIDTLLEIVKISSTSRENNGKVKIPFRSPHHTSSYVSMVEGGTVPKPGEITLSHGGILFLDEFPEFEKKTIEALREPLEDGSISISRAKATQKFPAKFILIAAMNPCPCGNKGNKNKKCICTANEISKYERKISGPIIDRIDIWVEVSNISYNDLGVATKEGENSLEVRNKIKKAREIMLKRNLKKEYKLNRDISSNDIFEILKMNEDLKKHFDMAAEKISLSPRAYNKTLKVARTIADIENSEDVKLEHLLEALQYRIKF